MWVEVRKGRARILLSLCSTERDHPSVPTCLQIGCCALGGSRHPPVSPLGRGPSGGPSLTRPVRSSRFEGRSGRRDGRVQSNRGIGECGLNLCVPLPT